MLKFDLGFGFVEGCTHTLPREDVRVKTACELDSCSVKDILALLYAYDVPCTALEKNLANVLGPAGSHDDNVECLVLSLYQCLQVFCAYKLSCALIGFKEQEVALLLDSFIVLLHRLFDVLHSVAGDV